MSKRTLPRGGYSPTPPTTLPNTPPPSPIGGIAQSNTTQHEILRLRAEIDTLLKRIATLREDRDRVSSHLVYCMYERDGWKDRTERAERILAALREPSEAVVDAIVMTLYPNIERSKLIQYLTPWLYNTHREAIHAAVAAAEHDTTLV